MALFAVFAALAAAALFALIVPEPRFAGSYSAAIYDSSGTLLGASIASDGQWRFPPPRSLPEKYVAALVAFEDKRFFIHPGVDPAALARAAVSDLRSGRIVSGGSTLSMQVARISLGKADRGIAQKALEALMALRLELGKTKPEILRLYAANAPFGGNVVGLEAAAWRYFGRSPENLSWAEAAMLAVLPNNPGLVHPGRNRDSLREKRDRLLGILYRSGKLDARSLRMAKSEPLPAEPFPLPRLATHLLERAKAESAGTAAVTTLDAELQRRLSSLLARRSGEFAKKGIENAACVVLDTRSGKALAYVGNVPPAPGRDTGQDVDAANSPRSSGSLLKPFLYAAMLDSGELYPQALVLDIPVRVGSYSPENNSKTYLGALPADQALARSLNVPAVRELRDFGVERFARLLSDMGISTLSRSYEDYGLPLILGGAEVNLWEMTGLYASLARCAMSKTKEEASRAFHPPRYLPDAGARPAPRVLVSPAAAYLAMEALNLGNRPEEEAAWADYASSRKIAWKTGTSYGNRDAWAIGVSPAYTVGVWVGNADGEGRPELKSALTAAPVMFEMYSSLPGSAWFEKPESWMKSITVCADSGFPAGPDCPRTKEISIPKGAKVGRACPYCRMAALSADGAYQLSASDPGGAEIVRQKRFVLPPAVEFYYRAWNFAYDPLPPRKPGSAQGQGDARISIIFPEEGSAVYIPVELSGQAGRAVFQSAHRDPGAVLFWHLDDAYLGSSSRPHKMEIQAAAGKHRLTVIDESGASASRGFVVLNEK